MTARIHRPQTIDAANLLLGVLTGQRTYVSKINISRVEKRSFFYCSSFFLTLYLEIIRESGETAKTVQNAPMTLHPAFPGGRVLTVQFYWS